jgi:hypothetical protein
MNTIKLLSHTSLVQIQKKQRGSTLLGVLFVLLLIISLGTLALRQGLTSLNLSTTVQAQALLLQSSDNIYFRIADPTSFIASTTKGVGLFGTASQLLLDFDQPVGTEMVFCYNPQTTANLFDGSTNKSYVSSDPTTYVVTNNSIGTSGYCNVNTPADYTSSRQAVMSQVSIKQTTCKTAPLTCLGGSTDPGDGTTPTSNSYRVNAVSILPSMALGSTTPADINNCLSNYMNDASDSNPNQATVTDCLAQHNIPYETQTGDIQTSSGTGG